MVKKTRRNPIPIDTQISSALREVWMKSPQRKDALKRSRKPCTDGSRKKWVECCEACGKTAYIGQKECKTKKDGTPSKVQRPVLVVHHINGVPNVWHPEFMSRLFCSPDELQVLCHACHDREHEPSKKETNERRTSTQNPKSNERMA